MSIIEVLEAHKSSVLGFKCTCGVDSPRTGEAESRPFLGHRQHLAQVLEQHELEAKAEALEETAANLAREADQFATTAERLTGHDNTRYHAYSAARQSIAHQLRNRAAQIKDTA